MRQLVQLQEQADEFKKLNTELLFVFREESDGVSGLKKIQGKVKEANRKHFLVSSDPKKQSSAAYSPKRMQFNNYVIDSKGVIRAEIDGSLRDRATAKELIKVLTKIEAE